MNDNCKRCKRQPTEKSVKMFDSWASGYCPSCFGRFSHKNITVKPIDPIEPLGCEKNPVDCYWSFVTNSYLSGVKGPCV